MSLFQFWLRLYLLPSSLITSEVWLTRGYTGVVDDICMPHFELSLSHLFLLQLVGSNLNQLQMSRFSIKASSSVTTPNKPKYQFLYVAKLTAISKIYFGKGYAATLECHILFFTWLRKLKMIDFPCFMKFIFVPGSKCWERSLHILYITLVLGTCGTLQRDTTVS